ncbi:MAG: hypothetical protein M1821_001246 [Bathelium mastoideum]|nr:MAG: hypothetical protein M1821_001246 [Bathelium mastoideum]
MPLVFSPPPDSLPSPQAHKRVKVASQDEIRGPRRPSKIFSPFRTIGLVSPTSVPFTSLPLGKTTFQITTCVGRSLHTYDLRRGLNLVFITRPQTPESITATKAWQEKVLAAWGGSEPTSARGIWVYFRGKKVGELECPHGFTENVRQIVIFGTWIVGCCSTRIEVWKSNTFEHYTSLVAPYSGPNGMSRRLTGGICNMPTYLNKIVAGREDGTIEIWNLSSNKLIYTILPAASSYGAVTAMQPTPALSLLAVAYENGPLIIHDIRHDKEVISFRSFTRGAPISSISFRTDGLGGGEDGRRSGVMATSSHGSGDITFWDLNSGGRRRGVLPGAHNAPVSSTNGGLGGINKVEFLPGQAILMSSGLDNALKSWIFDETSLSPIPRILHLRAGHAGPVSALQFLPPESEGTEANGKWLLSGSEDRAFWGWSLRRDGQSTELSQGNIQAKAKKRGLFGHGTGNGGPESLKAPKITCIASSLNRDGGIGALPGAQAIWNKSSNSKSTNRANAADSNTTGWESVVTGHQGDKFARTWFWGRKRAGRWVFPTSDGTDVTSVTVSPCGTFALIGSAGGGIDMFNLQSGIHRQRFPARLTQLQAKQLRLQQLRIEDELEEENDPNDPKKYKKGQGKHTSAITGLVVDNLNHTVISCGLDGKLKFWDFATGLLAYQIDFAATARTILGIRYHRPSDLIAINCNDGSIAVVDLQTQRIVRRLSTPSTTITDFCFSNDGRWIVAACVDSVIRVWDLPTGHLIDASRMRSKCTAIAFSNTGEYFATAREDSVGIDLWTNRTLFTQVPTRPIEDGELAELDAPTTSGDGGESVVAATLEEPADGAAAETAAPLIEQLSEEMITLSLVPKARWQTLLHLDLIRERNKPKEAPKAPEKAPFFLPSLQSQPKLITDSGAENQPAPEQSRVLKFNRSAAQSPFTSLLHIAQETEDYADFIAHLKTLPPSAADLEVRSLDPATPCTELIGFVAALTQRLRAHADFELVQAWMAVFLRVHGEVVVRDAALAAAVGEWREEHERETRRLRGLVGYCGGVVEFLRGI